MFRSFVCAARAVLGFVCLLLVTGLGTAAHAQDREAPLLYAGFAFSGDYGNRDQLYRHSAALSAEESGAYLDRLLREKLLQRTALARRVSLELADGKRDQASVAFALVQEEVENQQIDGRNWVILSLQANVLAYDKATGSIVACYPLRMRVARVRDSEPSEDEVRAMVREAYTSANPRENIFDLWLDRLEQVRLRQGARKYLRVTDVTLSPQAEKVVVDSGRSPAAVRNQIANFLEASVGEGAGVPLVPQSVGEAIGSKMAYRFANGEEIQLAVPEADFALSFVVRDFVSKKLEKPEYFQDIFRVKGSIAIRQPDLQKVILDENVYDTLIVTRPRRAGVQLSDWNQYAKTLQALVLGLGKQMASTDDRWLKENASRGMEARPGFQRAGELMKDLM